MSKVDTKGATYCVIQSGYTGRLVNDLGFYDVELIKKDDREKKRKHNIYKMKHSTVTDEYLELVDNWNKKYSCYDEDIDNFFEQFLYISDTLHGKGTYYVKSKNVEKIQNILKSEGMDISGIICFKTSDVYDHMRHIKILKVANFCACFGAILNITIIEKDDEKIIYYDIDAESG